VKFFVFLNLTIALILSGSLTYAVIRLETQDLESISDLKKTPVLQKFADKQLQDIFKDIAKSNSTEDSKPFLERAKKYTSHSPKVELTYKGININLKTPGVTSYIRSIFREISYGFIRGKPDLVRSDFNNLISLLMYLGTKINQSHEITPEQKQEILNNLSEQAWTSYSTVLDGKPMSLKDALIEQVNSENIESRIRYGEELEDLVNFITNMD
jgi:hypothetical protein